MRRRFDWISRSWLRPALKELKGGGGGQEALLHNYISDLQILHTVAYKDDLHNYS